MEGRVLTAFTGDGEVLLKRFKKIDRDVFSVCVHEASHALVAHIFGFKVHRLKVWEGEEYIRGFTSMELPRCPILDAFVTLAGSAGESLWQKRTKGEVSQDDWQDMKRRRISGMGLALVLPQLNKLLRKNKKAIYRLAKGLKKTKNVARKEFLEIIRAS